MKGIFYYCIFSILYKSIISTTKEKIKKFERIEVESFDANASVGYVGESRRFNADDLLMKDEDYKTLEQRARQRTRELTCITCNNVDTRACSHPKANAVLSERCPDPEDRCLSLHTPFGIVKRSCFNINRKQLLYFCVCDLCNDIPIDIMHTMQFTVKRDWVNNVAQITHAMRLKKTVKSQLKCVYCEVTGSNETDEACRAGIYQSVGSCPSDEVCGIRVVKERGSVTRGCVAGPIYNYLYNFCDTDNCNDDPVVSVYDPD